MSRRRWTIRYLHPAQLDDLCAEAGLTLEYRSNDWTGTDSTIDDRHVSVYRNSG